MGKAGEDHRLQSAAVAQGSAPIRETGGCRCWCSFLGFRCVFVLLFSAAVFLSAIFWLPPFLHSSDRADLDLDSQYKDHDIVASFHLQKPTSLLGDSISQLATDIYAELDALNAKVVILSLEPVNGSNTTKVVFAVDPDVKYSKISSTARSLIKASFESLVIGQSSLRLNESLFGDPFSFEVLQFDGGITVIPPQSAFLLQKVQIPFNFTLNFSIHQIQVNFNELTSQLKSGLHLASYENLYIRLSNAKGSTVVPPVTVQSFVLLAIGNNPSTRRLKQLAQTITGSHSKNLGLNNTVFGRVKQVHLSSILQHSLHGGEGGAPTSAPSPAPLPPPHPHHHPHHHHHHHHHFAPTISPAPSTERNAPVTHKSAPAPEDGSPVPAKNYEAKPPGCQLRCKGKGRRHFHVAPSVAPMMSPHHPTPSPHHSAQTPHPNSAPSAHQSSAPSPRPRSHPHSHPHHAAPSSHHHSTLSPHHSTLSPQPHGDSPAPVSHPVPASSPLPNVAFAHVEPPSKTESDAGHSSATTSVSPSPSSSSSAGLGLTAEWAFLLSLALILHM